MNVPAKHTRKSFIEDLKELSELDSTLPLIEPPEVKPTPSPQESCAACMTSLPVTAVFIFCLFVCVFNY